MIAQNHKQTRVALITGGARRIGAEIARSLHAAGMNVIVHYHASHQAVMQLCKSLNKKRPNSALPLRADLANTESADFLIKASIAHFGKLSVLINNASRFYRTKLGKTTAYDWEDLLATNLKAPFFLSQSAAPYLKAEEGCIINIADIYASQPRLDYSVYCLSKAGLVNLTKALAKELGPKIRVNAISPGAVLWPEGDNALNQADKARIIKSAALKRAGSAADIAKTVLFLVQDAPFITGQILAVDGGRML